MKTSKMFLLTIYENGQRRYTAPINRIPDVDEGTTINCPGLQTSVKLFPDGTRIDSIVQEITETEFDIYKRHSEVFTAKSVF